jgi:penicillin-insensitive murein DD-endopeptidase
MRGLALVALIAGCAELGVISDGTSLSVGKAHRGYLIEGVRLPDRGDGFVTREVWRARDNRYGTDELVDLLTAVSRRMRAHARDVRLVVADLSGRGGGERLAFHRSHQSGRDVDILYYTRDAAGKPFEPETMQKFNSAGRATDGSGVMLDVPRTWSLVKELLTAPEAMVQWVFMYEPIAKRLIEHAERIGEPEPVLARARKALRQPSAMARHDDHMHVRVYCSAADRAYGCVDIGPMELLAEREAEPSPVHELLGVVAASPPASLPAPAAAVPTAAVAIPAEGVAPDTRSSVRQPAFARFVGTRSVPACVRRRVPAVDTPGGHGTVRPRR